MFVVTPVFDFLIKTRTDYYISTVLKLVIGITLAIYFISKYISLLMRLVDKFLIDQNIVKSYLWIFKKDNMKILFKMACCLVPFLALSSFYIFNISSYFNKNFNMNFSYFFRFDNWLDFNQGIKDSFISDIFPGIKYLFSNEFHLTIIVISFLILISILFTSIFWFCLKISILRISERVTRRFLKNIKIKKNLYENNAKAYALLINYSHNEDLIKNYLDQQKDEDIAIANYKKSILLTTFKKSSEPPYALEFIQNTSVI
ncbi:hypothetical protein [Spiroplasma tabanidicola]|nr:hypothetical protein [Spiroplasma tabanidicola]